MRWAVLVALAGCAGGAGLDHRVTVLENKPPPPPDQTHELAVLEARIAEQKQALDAQQGEIAQLQKIVHELGDQLADLQADSQPPLVPAPELAPPPPAPGPRGTLDPAKVYAVTLDDAPRFGLPDAAVTLVAAVQFPEPYTHKSWPVLTQLRTEYGKELRLVVKSYVVHSQANDSTIAACAVGKQGKHLDAFEQQLYDKAMGAGPRVWFDAAQSRELAKSLGVDLAKFDKDVAGSCKTGVASDQKLFQRLGQSATPTFWINGRPLSGAQPIDAFRKIIDDERQKVAADRKAGNRTATFYDRVVVKGGATTGP